jgi:SAM-dependent methyltransferase
MSSEQDYLNMQFNFYEQEAAKWSISNKDPVVGGYEIHNAFSDYDEFLFKDFDTKNLIALEYGCGPGRNIVRFSSRFKRIDGVDISGVNIEKAKDNLNHHNIPISQLYVNDGKSIPCYDESYDVVFSTICLQHICVHSIRFFIMQEIYRILKPSGKFCFQMGFGGRPNSVNYYDNNTGATKTNSECDVSIENEDYLISDLKKIGFKNYKSDIRIPCIDLHKNWIWVQVEK